MKLQRVLFLGIILLLASCQNSQNPDKGQLEQNAVIQLFNDSSYSVIVHRDAFSGVVIAELESGELKEVKVAASNNYGIGTTFSIEYKTKVFNEFETACGDVYAYGIDPNMQITMNLETGKEYQLRIEQPSDLVFETSFIRIINSSANYYELRNNGICYKQAGNGALTVDTGKTGVYEIPVGSKGKNFEGYKLTTVFSSLDIPSFLIEYNRSYTFVFDGESITKVSDNKLSY